MIYNCIQPEYVKYFHCNGSLCNSKCCRGWQIEIDDETYVKYCQLPESEIRTAILTKLQRHPQTNRYRFHMDGINCPMLCMDKLCLIQKTYGESYLSCTCDQFPRRTHLLYRDTVERVLSFACPVAARLALLSPAPMKLESINIDTQRGKSFFPLPVAAVGKIEDLLTLQMNGISILQNREYTINKRLQMLGGYLWLIQEGVVLDEACNVRRIEQVVLPWRFDYTSWCRFLLELLDELYGTAIVLADDNDIDYVPYIIRAFHLEGKQRKSLKELTAIYKKGCQLVQDCIMPKYSHMMEHYLVQEFFGNLYPYKWGTLFIGNYMIYLVIYRFMELILMSMLLIREKIDEENIILLIGRMAQRTNHANLYGQLIWNKLEQDDGVIMDRLMRDIK